MGVGKAHFDNWTLGIEAPFKQRASVSCRDVRGGVDGNACPQIEIRDPSGQQPAISLAEKCACACDRQTLRQLCQHLLEMPPATACNDLAVPQPTHRI